MLIEAFAARLDEIDGTLLDYGPSGSGRPEVEINFLSEVSIETLGEILGVTGIPPEPPTGARVFGLPAEVRDALADAHDLGAVAEQWAQTEELQMDEVTAEDALDRLQELAKLARTARDDGRDLWAWFSV